MRFTVTELLLPWYSISSALSLGSRKVTMQADGGSHVLCLLEDEEGMVPPGGQGIRKGGQKLQE